MYCKCTGHEADVITMCTSHPLIIGHVGAQISVQSLAQPPNFPHPLSPLAALSAPGPTPLPRPPAWTLHCVP